MVYIHIYGPTPSKNFDPKSSELTFLLVKNRLYIRKNNKIKN